MSGNRNYNYNYDYDNRGPSNPNPNPSTTNTNVYPTSATSRLTLMQAQYQQRQREDKEQKLLQMLDSQQQRAIQKASQISGGRYVYGNGNGNYFGGQNSVWNSPSQSQQSQFSPQSTQSLNNYQQNIYNNSNMTSNANITAGNGKVRQMFEERRKVGGVVPSKNIGPNNNIYSTSKLTTNKSTILPQQGVYRNGGIAAGIDKGYPLEPMTKNIPVRNLRTTSSKSDPSPNAQQNYTNSHQSLNSRSSMNNSMNNSTSPIRRPAPSPTLSLGKSRANSSQERISPVSRRSPAQNSSASRNANTTSNSYFDDIDGFNSNSKSSSMAKSNGVPQSTKFRDVFGSGNNSTTGNHRTSPAKINDYDSALGGLDSKFKKMNVTSPRSNASSPSVVNSNFNSNSNSSSAGSFTAKKSPTTTARSPSRVLNPSKPFPNRGLDEMKSPSQKAPARSSSSGPPPGLEECKVCNRYFASDRLEKHMSICKKVSTKKRKVFDPTKMRVQGTEAEKYVLRKTNSKASGNSRVLAQSSAPAAKPKGDWRKKHEDFIKTIRLAKEFQQHIAKGGKASDLPPPPPSDTSDYIQCPHCKRRFSQGAAERHIPKCQNIRSNKR